MSQKFLEVRRAGLAVRHTGAVYPDIDGAPFGEGVQPSIISQIWDMLWRRKWTVLAGLVSVLVVAALVTWKLPRSYTSTVTVLVGSGPRNAGLTELDLLNQSPAIQTEMELITSRRILEPVVDENDLHVRITSPGPLLQGDLFNGFQAGRDVVPGAYEIKKAGNGAYEMWKTGAGGVLGFWQSTPDSLVATLRPGLAYSGRGLRFQLPATMPDDPVEMKVSPFDGAVGTLMTNVTASLVDPDAQLVRVSCKSGGAKLAQRVCDGISKSYVGLRNDLARGDASHSAEFLQQQSDTVGAQLAAAEDELRQYKEANDVVDTQSLSGAESGELAQFQARRDGIDAERAALAGFINRLGTGEGSDKYRDLAAYPTFINNPMVGDILNNLINYENQLHDLSQRRTDVNPDVVALKQRISELQGQIGHLARNYESALSGQVASLDQTLGQFKGRLASVPRKQMDLARLERHAEMLSQLYTTLQQKLKEAQISKAVELADVSIIDPPTFPMAPSFPNVPLNLALGLVGGLLVGLAGALLQEFADTRVRRRHEIEQETGLPVLTMIPSVKGGRFIVGRTARLLPSGAAAGSRLRDYYPAGGELVVEAFRSLGADLSFMAQSMPGGDVRSVVFTSPSRGEGKTFSAVNFAATRALEGQRTLLIDADLRAGAASAALGLEEAPGLSDVLAGKSPLLDAIRMVKIGNHRLAVLGAGTTPRDHGTLVTSDELEEVLATAAEHFDQVVVDTPPINVVSDAALVAARAHAVIVVVRSGHTDREALDLTLSRLARVGARPLGIVLNDVKVGSGDYEGFSVYEPEAQEAAG